MKKILAMIIFLILFVEGKSQTPMLPAALLKKIDSSRIISFCECVHGSDQLYKAQVAFVKELKKYNKIGTISFESNHLYLNQRKIAAEILLLDSTIKLIGYNPGYLYGSYQLIKKNLAISNPKLLQSLSGILNKLDSNEAYYWYSLKQNQYDNILQQLTAIQTETMEPIYQTYIRQLKFDLTYLKFRRINGDKIRDSLMFQFIKENISNDPSVKHIIFGHCGHLSLKNPLHANNLGAYLHNQYSNDLLTIGNDSRAIQLIYRKETQYHCKKALKLEKIPYDGVFVSTIGFQKRKHPVYLIGSNFNFRKKIKLIYSENYDWLFYLDKIDVIMSN